MPRVARSDTVMGSDRLGTQRVGLAAAGEAHKHRDRGQRTCNRKEETVQQKSGGTMQPI